MADSWLEARPTPGQFMVWIIAIVAVGIYAAIRKRGDAPIDQDAEKYHAKEQDRADEQLNRADKQLDRLDKLHDRQEAIWDRIEALVKRLEDRLDKG
jgi:hypothetical protein